MNEREHEEDKQAREAVAGEEALKKPSILNQAIPYAFTAAILIWVFSSLASSVVDERHVLKGTQWAALDKPAARAGSVEVLDPSRDSEYCGALESELGEACPDGADYVIAEREETDTLELRRTADSGIPDGGEVSVDYVKDVRLRDVWVMVKAADLRVFLPVMILHCLVFFLADILSFGQAYRFFNVPDMDYKEIAVMRGAPYVVQVGLAAFAEVLFPLYLWRVKKVPVTEALSSNIWTIIIDTAAIFSVLTPGVLYNLFVENLVPAVGWGWLVVCGVYWTVLIGNIVFWHRPVGKRTAERIAARRAGGEAGEQKSGLIQLLRTFSMARWDQYLRVYLVRAGLWASPSGSST